MCKERPHPGAQLRFTDIGGHRFTCFATSTRGGQPADLELRHRRRARCEDRIRCAKDTGLRNLPLHGYAQNQIWCEIVRLACELTAWMQMLAPHATARRREPKRLRLRIFTAAARLVRGGRRIRVRLAQRWPGHNRSPSRSLASKPSRPADQPKTIQRPGKDTAGQWNPPARHGSRAQTLTTVSKRPQVAGLSQPAKITKDAG